MNRLAKRYRTRKQPTDGNDEMFRKVMEHAPIGMAVANDSKQITYANAAFFDLLGYRQADLGALTLDKVSPVDKLSSARLQFERMYAGKIGKFNADCQIERKDGSLVWVRVSASTQSDNNRCQFILQLTDIEQLKRTEDEIAYKESRWNYALEAAQHGVWDHDIRTDKMFCSPMWQRMRGYGPGEEVDPAVDKLLKRIHPDDRQNVLERLGKQDQGEEGYDTLEYRERHRDGHYVWIFSRGRPIEWAEDGTAIRTVGIDIDISEQKLVEAQLAAEKERLRVTLQSLSEGVISTDAQARITFMNKIAEQMTGWQAEKAIGEQISAIFRSTVETEDGDVEPVNAVAHCLESGEICRPNEYSRVTNLSGARLYVRESAAPVRAEDGSITGAVIVFQDSTARRKLQEELTYSATHDSLTRLPNRLAFDAKLLAMKEDANKGDNQHVLCLIDLDHFKQVNDEGGHSAGDALLKDIANRIRSCCRHYDFASRIGGDEFAVILDGCSLENALTIAQKIIDTISGSAFVWGKSNYKIGASIGLAPITAGTQDVDVVYRQADAACYEAKARGRNCVVVATEKSKRRRFFNWH